MEAQAVACNKIAMLQAQYSSEQKHWSATVQNLNNESALIMDKMAPVVRFIERLCTHLKDRFLEDNRLCNCCIFDYSCIKQANFNFGLNELQQLLKQFSYFFHCYGPGRESDTLNAYNDFKFLAKERFKAGRNGLSQRSANSGSRPKFGSQRLRAWVAKVLNVQPTNRYSTLNLGELDHFEGRPQQQFQGCRTPYFQRWLN